jgi:hypothetical protein
LKENLLFIGNYYKDYHKNSTLKPKAMKKIFLTVTTIFLSVSLLAQDAAMLKLNLEKNKVYRLKSTSEQTVNQTVNGNQQTVESNVGYTVSMKMIDATSDFMILEVHLDTLVTKTNTMGKVISFSSTSEGDIKSSEMSDIMSYILNRLSKNVIYAKVNFTGKPLEIVNAKMLSDMILKDTSSIVLTGPTALAVKAQVVSTVSETNLKNIIASFTYNLPDKEVSTGESWTITQQINSGGMLLDIKTDYRLDAVKENDASITVESSIRAPENAVPIKSGGATVTYDNLQGSSKSKLVVDITTGLVVDEKAESHISGELGISGPGFSMQMPMSIFGKSSISELQ